MLLTVSRTLWTLLSHDGRQSALALLVWTLVGTVLETLGVGIIVPALGVFTAQDPASLPIVGPWLRSVGWTPAQLAVGCMLVLVAVYVMKAIYLSFLAWRQASFAFAVQTDVSQRLFLGYLRQPWTFHLQRNSAELIRNITSEVANLNNVLQACIGIATEGLVLAALATLLLVVEPVGTAVVIGMLGLGAWSFHRFTRARLLQWGEIRQRQEGLRLQHVQQGLGGVKDIKLLGREDEFFGQYQRHNDATAAVARRQVTLQALPRLWLELLAVTGLASLVLVMLARDTPPSSLVPTLGLFAAAAFRLMPSAIRVMNSLQVIRYYVPSITTLYGELRHGTIAPSARARTRVRFERELALDRVIFNYPGARTVALQDVSLAIRPGESVAFIGGSGAGKSTLVDVLLGLLAPASGSVTVDGIDIRSDLRAWQDQIGYVPQTIYLTDDTIRRNVAFGLSPDAIDDAAVRRALTAARLDEFVDGLPQGVDTTVGERGVQLSGGQRQRIGIARALYHDPPVIVLDEATSSLDLTTEREVMEAVKALQGVKTLVIVAHRLSTVAHCDRVYKVEQGRIVAAGTFQAVAEV